MLGKLIDALDDAKEVVVRQRDVHLQVDRFCLKDANEVEDSAAKHICRVAQQLSPERQQLYLLIVLEYEVDVLLKVVEAPQVQLPLVLVC